LLALQLSFLKITPRPEMEPRASRFPAWSNLHLRRLGCLAFRFPAWSNLHLRRLGCLAFR
jgi:hypothetical protein